jgi:hypothetical protein
MSTLTPEERAELEALRKLAAAVRRYVEHQGAIEAAADAVRDALPPAPPEGTAGT